MQYLAVIHADEGHWDALPAAERERAMETYGTLARESVVLDG